MKGFEAELEAAGFSGFLTKPIDVDALLRDLAQRLGARRSKTASNCRRLTAQPLRRRRRRLPSVAGTAVAGPTGADDARRRWSRGWPATRGWRRIAARFASSCRPSWQRPPQRRAARALTELAALAHWLKGAGGSMGFDELFEPAKPLEHAATAGEPCRSRPPADAI